MNIFDIFNIKFATNISEEKKNEISEKIKNIKLYNILNLNPGILNQYIIVISCLCSLYAIFMLYFLFVYPKSMYTKHTCILSKTSWFIIALQSINPEGLEDPESEGH